MNKVAALTDKQRDELFRETASRMHTTNAIVEKDFWVVWTLDKLFSHDSLSKILMFKGGTSLSKVFGLIERFSEDIDLILNWKLLTDDDPYGDRTKTQQNKFNEHINEEAKVYIKEELLPLVANIIKSHCTCQIDDEDGFKINVQYPALFSDVALLPQILLEIGPLALWLPSDSFKISPYAAKEFPGQFSKPTCRVNAILAKRTFWEKATILHQEANRSETKLIPPRHSRHYYDLAMMAKSTVREEALADVELLKDVAEFKKKFYPSAWARYDDAKVGMLKLLPPEYRYKELKEDYRAMRNMIFGEYIAFEEIISTLRELEKDINSLTES
ncbi:MAG: nucleotidyl transferase AbiEii/AbiGii toxin family protein [Candidatus Tenebribacter davisii]|nr:nucleotidyl transferase AbiEii/AbiGii toxin family protein [Candidatus Tenebribacter davisii]